MNNLYFDTFKKEEKIFEEVVKKYKPELMPSWHHWWFYRQDRTKKTRRSL